MGSLPKFTLSHNERRDQWELRHDNSRRLVESFERKADATAGGSLSAALGPNGGSVKIKKMDGAFQEERTFPRSADPRSSKG
ncbi:DUF2188 domain-containing protein [Bradyrhizobium sp. NBAIM03]|uniref:DUF2188 domain-containing protein n=1 Tax=Bradyrhizobium sp. NBAIM03 TaxID=2793816 RepID=UPI001CD40EED|nr:DUF2188 domain-containing protein [Bradyrhizobium sp. NBAIM03]MCA1532801.1 DUF2188 domain-containing protein [Bradyrhizobium sp. NBAIM03]